MTSTFVNFRQNNSGLLVNIDDAIVLVSKLEDHLRLLSYRAYSYSKHSELRGSLSNHPKKVKYRAKAMFDIQQPKAQLCA